MTQSYSARFQIDLGVKDELWKSRAVNVVVPAVGFARLSDL
jgi:hypothetical protein